MSFTAAIAVAVIATIAVVAASFVSLVSAWRRREVVTLAPGRFGWASALKEPALWGAILLAISMALPWITGSVVGVRFPHSAFSLPWLRWIVLLPLVLLIGLSVWQLSRPNAWLRLALVVGFSAATVLGSVVLVIAALAQKLSRYAVVADTILRGVGHASQLVPVLRVGPGELAYVGAGLLGSVGTVIRYSHRSESSVGTGRRLRSAAVGPLMGGGHPGGRLPDSDAAALGHDI